MNGIRRFPADLTPAPRGFLDEDRQDAQAELVERLTNDGRPVAVDHLFRAAVTLDPQHYDNDFGHNRFDRRFA